ncbi:MAG TPA: carboxypeptidase regulatory-like domain-containing protein [Candidatus Brocadiia bacterium]|nr:carboxypeptidase regulatory-like domain-containing protein [Candidatus Brocadiales bacterium]
MEKLFCRLPLLHQICLPVLLIVIFFAMQIGVAEKTCLAFDVTCVVKDKSNNEPIPEAVVRLIGVEPLVELKLGITDDNGKFVFIDVEAGKFDLSADAQCYKRKEVLDRAISGKETITFKLDAVETGLGSLSGKVEDGVTVDGVNGATVKILPNGPTEQTVEDGSYLFDCVEAGSYRVSADKDGYIEEKKAIEVIEGTPTTLDFILIPAKIVGTVTNSDTLAPIGDVLVEALLDDVMTANKKTKNSGKYALNLNPGTYIIRGSKDGYSTYTSDEIPLGSEGAVTHDFSLAFAGGGISGMVLDSDGDPLIGAEVILADTALIRNFDVTTKTNTQGEYGFNNLELGTYEVSLSEGCYANGGQQSQQVELTSEAPQGTADFNLTEITNQGTLAGRVRDKDTKEPLADATVRITKPISEASTTTTDDNGIFRFDQCLIAGTNYAVRAEKDCYITIEKKLKPAEEGENLLTFNLALEEEDACSTTTITTTTTTTTTTSTTTSTSTTTTTTDGSTTTTLCEPCEGEPASITFSKTCNSFTFAISGESGPRRNNLTYKRDNHGRVIFACGTVTYTNSGNTYCVEIDVEWGKSSSSCIKSIQGFAMKP